MLKKFFLALVVAIFLAACQSQSAPAPTARTEVLSEMPPEAPLPLPTATLAATETPLSTPTALPTETLPPEPTATLVPTDTPLPEPTVDASIFGSINAVDAPVGFMLEPIAQVIFEAELQKRVDAGEIGGFQVEGLSIVPRGDGTFFAEIFYALQADASFWPEDFGTPDGSGWVRGKCTIFDFEMGTDVYALKNKKVCS